MNIRALYPTTITGNPTPIIERLNKLGFHKIHQRNNLLEDGLVEQVFENESGQRADIVYVENFENDAYCVRINVDDFDTALKFYSEEGFEVFKGPSILPTSKNVLLRSASTNLLIMLMQHTEK